MGSLIEKLEAKVLGGEQISFAEAGELYDVPESDVFDLMASANRIRRQFKGDRVDLCAIINARSGRCPEDCAFCSQSAHHRTDIQVYGLVGADEIRRCADEAHRMGAHRFGIVTSGKSVTPGKDLEEICVAIRQLKEMLPVVRCASLGVLTQEIAQELREAGLESFHHNLETARSFYPEICTTRSYEENVEAVLVAREFGFQTCSGGIFGMGESPSQRVELAFTLRELDVDSVPLNFLMPIPGTRLEKASPLKPLEVLKVIAVYRFILPEKDVRICGGREVNLRDLQSMMFMAGANATMLGNYLTTSGRDYRADLQMIGDLGLEV